MTKAEIKYNPFKRKTEITINEDAIATTSDLYRYRNTPLEDWVDVLIPKLVEYCNDDDITLSIFSVQSYIDTIKDQVNDYSKKNRHVVIDVTEEASIGYKGRLSKIEHIEKEMSAAVSPNDATPDVQILVVSMSGEEEYAKATKELFGVATNPNEGYLITNFQHEEEGFLPLDAFPAELEDNFINIEFLVFPLLETCSNKYWRKLKEVTAASENYILLAHLNHMPRKNDELYNYISEHLERKGYLNRSRFLFVCDNAEENEEYLRDEYGARNISMLDPDYVKSSLRSVKKYIQNVCYVDKINEKSSLIRCNLQAWQSRSVAGSENANLLKTLEEEYLVRVDLLAKYCDALTIHRAEPLDFATLVDEIIEAMPIAIAKNMRERIDQLRQAPEKKGYSYYYWSGSTVEDIIMHSEPVRMLTKENVNTVIGQIFMKIVQRYLRHRCYNTLCLKSNTAELNGSVVLEDCYPATRLIEEVLSGWTFPCSISTTINISASEKHNHFFAWVVESEKIYDSNRLSDTDQIKRRLRTRKDDIRELLIQYDHAMRAALSELLESKKIHMQTLFEKSIEQITGEIANCRQADNINTDDTIKFTDVEAAVGVLDGVVEL